MCITEGNFMNSLEETVHNGPDCPEQERYDQH